MLECVPSHGAFLFIACAGATHAQQAAQRFPDAPGRDVTLRLCFQCHGDGMWRDHRQDRRGWEGVLYRMIGRGALWTEDEIATMAGYLAAVQGPPGKTSK